MLLHKTNRKKVRKQLANGKFFKCEAMMQKEVSIFSGFSATAITMNSN